MTGSPCFINQQSIHSTKTQSTNNTSSSSLSSLLISSFIHSFVPLDLFKHMGFLNLQMIQWVFQLMGNHISCMHLSTSIPETESSNTKKKPSPSQHHQQQQLRTIKLIKSDGIVKIYNRPINASELMLEFPKHLVCHSDSFYIGKKILPLSENEKLQLGQKYFLLPTHFFQSVLSFVTIASSFAANSQSSKNAFLKKAAAGGGGGTSSSCLPFDIQKTPSGSLQIRVSDEFISNLLMEEEENQKQNGDQDHQQADAAGGNYLCTTPQLQKDYKQLVGCNRQWKPKLDSIKESRMKRLGSFGIKMRRSRNNNNNNKSDDGVEEIFSQKMIKKKKKNTQTSIPEQHHHQKITSRSLSSSN